MGWNNNSNYNNNNNNNSNNGAKVKKSGFSVMMKEGVPICSGWRKTKMGLQKLYARPYNGSKEVTSDSGKTWINLFVTLTTDVGVVKTSGMFNMGNNKLYIKEMNLIGTTNGGGQTSSGKYSKGYFGKHMGSVGN